jgi:hypothetical protein
MGLGEPPGRAAGGTAPVIVVGLDGSPASRRRLRDPCAVETERPPAPGPRPSVCGAARFVVPPASQPARYAAGDAGRRAPSKSAAQWKRTSHPRRIDLGGFRRTDGQRPTRSDSAAIWDPCRTNRCLRLVTAVRAALHTSNDSAATPGEQASAWAWAQFWAHSPPSATVHRCSLRSCSRSWRTAADAGERRATVLESVLGATPQEFESPILRHLTCKNTGDGRNTRVPVLAVGSIGGLNFLAAGVPLLMPAVSVVPGHRRLGQA